MRRFAAIFLLCYGVTWLHATLEVCLDCPCDHVAFAHPGCSPDVTHMEPASDPVGEEPGHGEDPCGCLCHVTALVNASTSLSPLFHTVPWPVPVETRALHYSFPPDHPPAFS